MDAPKPVKKKRISVQSAKAKGRNLQKEVRNEILARFPMLEPDDVRSTSMGASGEDLQLSPLARRLLKISVECKARARVGVYPWIFQAVDNAPKDTVPVLVVRQDHAKPLAVVDLGHYLDLLQRWTESNDT